MLLAAETLSVELVDLLSSGRTSREPSALRRDLQSTDRRFVTRGVGHSGCDRLAGENGRRNRLGRQRFEGALLFRGCGRIDSRIKGLAEAGSDLAIMLARIFTRACGQLSGQQSQDEAVFICGPHTAIVAEEARARAFLAAETAGAIEQSRRKPF